jgi:2-oxoglutarate dehydrogenase E2 component (dihydrolipoamide succinyltransferase)
MIDIKVPTIGESITEVTLVKWVKQDGDYVERDEVIAEFESEKATFEVNAEKAGVLKTNAAEGETLNIGSVLAQIDDAAQKSNGAAPAPAPASAPQAQEPAPVAQPQEPAAPVAEAAHATKATGKGVIEIKVPTIGESITEVTLLKWIKKEGDLVTRDEVIAEFESEKATFELNAEEAGKLSTKANEGDTIKIGDVVASIDTDVAVGSAPKETKAAAPQQAATPHCTDLLHSKPLLQLFQMISKPHL